MEELVYLVDRQKKRLHFGAPTLRVPPLNQELWQQPLLRGLTAKERAEVTLLNAFHSIFPSTFCLLWQNPLLRDLTSQARTLVTLLSNFYFVTFCLLCQQPVLRCPTAQERGKVTLLSNFHSTSSVYPLLAFATPIADDWWAKIGLWYQCSLTFSPFLQHTFHLRLHTHDSHIRLLLRRHLA